MRWRVCTRGWTLRATTEPVRRTLLFAALCLPLAWLGYAIAGELNQPGSALGADPGEAVVLFLGEWGLRLLLLTLAVTTARRLTGWAELLAYRRMIGLFPRSPS